MSERLDRIEALLEGHGLAMAELRTRQEVTQLHIDRIDGAIERLTEQSSQLTEQSSQLNDKLDRLANIVLRIHNRQDDHEDRINRLEQE
jgi:septation ring formation regulator EzrA